MAGLAYTGVSVAAGAGNYRDSPGCAPRRISHTRPAGSCDIYPRPRTQQTPRNHVAYAAARRSEGYYRSAGRCWTTARALAAGTGAADTPGARGLTELCLRGAATPAARVRDARGGRRRPGPTVVALTRTGLPPRVLRRRFKAGRSRREQRGLTVSNPAPGTARGA